MIPTSERQRALTAFLVNPYWRNIYDRAPAGAKSLLELQFLESEIAEELEDELDDEIASTETRLKAEDWRYMLDVTPEAPGAAARVRRRYAAFLAACEMS